MGELISLSKYPVGFWYVIDGSYEGELDVVYLKSINTSVVNEKVYFAEVHKASGVVVTYFAFTEDKLKNPKRFSTKEGCLTYIKYLIKKRVEGALPDIKEDKKVTEYSYKIFYHQGTGDKNSYLDKTVKLSGIRALARYLNRFKRDNPKFRVTVVTVVDDAGGYLSYVKFNREEVKNQRWITGKKERLLAHAKYELGYDLSYKMGVE